MYQMYPSICQLRDGLTSKTCSQKSVSSLSYYLQQDPPCRIRYTNQAEGESCMHVYVTQHVRMRML